MRVYQIFVPELNAYVKFKVLPPEDISSFLEDIDFTNEDVFCRAVLEHLVFNMKTEIRESLKMMSTETAKATIEALYNGCIMLNPGLDLDTWVSMAYVSMKKTQNADVAETAVSEPKATKRMPTQKRKKLSDAKFANLRSALSDKIIGQDEAIEIVVNALKRSQAGLADENRPLGVFLFAGASGVGKTSLAKELHAYLYGKNTSPVRIDCGEFQQKHDAHKLIGAPPSYVGYDDGGQLTNGVNKNPNTVVLIDEIEKAHPDVWHTFLRIFDEGFVTDGQGNLVDFRNTIIILTTNLGNDTIVQHLTEKGAGFRARVETQLKTKDIPPRSIVERHANEAIKKLFKPEFLNRIDSIVVFNHLTPEDFANIADLEMRTLDEKLSKRGISFNWDDAVVAALIDKGVDTVMGARGMSAVRRDQIETILADAILAMKSTRGVVIDLTYDENFTLDVRKPKRVKYS